MLLVNDSHHFNCVLLQLVSLIKKNNQGNILLPIMLHIYVGFYPSRQKCYKQLTLEASLFLLTSYTFQVLSLYCLVKLELCMCAKVFRPTQWPLKLSVLPLHHQKCASLMKCNKRND